MRKWFALIILFSAACLPAEKRFERVAPFKPGSLRIHVAQETPAAGLTATVAEQSTIYMNPSPELTEEHLGKIAIGRGRTGDRILMLTFTDEGAATLARVTAANVGKRMVFIVAGRVVMAPVLQSQIANGAAVIEGSFTEEEAERLAKALSGS